MSDEQREEPGAGEAGGEQPDDELEPATWAGRRKWEGLPDDPEAEDSAGDDQDADDPEADDPEDARADEGPEPGDEFEYDEGDEDGAEAGGDGELEDGGDGEAEAEAAGDENDRDGEGGAEEDSEAKGTVEADTLALADSEEARDAAMAGLRARTAKHAAKRGVTDPGHKPAPPVDEKADAEEAGDGDGEEAEEGAKSETISSETAPVAAEASAQPRADEQEAPKAGLWARFVAASFLIIASMATATAVSILVYLTDIAQGLGGLGGLSSQLDQVDEKAQTFLILGSDVRPNAGDDRGLSDTTILLRVDPDKGLISQLSIPRDLRVNIPGHGVDKFNAAYSYGGPKLTYEVVKKSIVGEDVPIHHVVNVDFNGFADAVNAIDCVYVDVDRHYFNDNSTAASFTEQYAEINVEAGYQRLCGYKALQYVRYRHEDNDIVRAARQQGFLREARAAVPPSKLLNERNELIDIFTEYTTSDIDDPGTLVVLARLMIDARNAQVRQVTFPFDSLNAEGYVTAQAEPLRAAVDEFMGVGIEPVDTDDDGGGGGSGGKPKDEQSEDKPDEPPPPPPMLDATASAQQYTAALRGSSEGELKFPILYPTMLVPGSTISDDTRFFRVDGPGDDIYRGYKFVVSFPGVTYPTAYYGVSGMDWPEAPLFKNPTEARVINDRTYQLYTDGGQIRMVAFERSGIMYWVTNSLDNLVTNEEMMAIVQNLAVSVG